MSAQVLHANSAGQSEFLVGIHIIMLSSLTCYCHASFFIPHLGAAQTAVSRHVAIILLAIPDSCCLWRTCSGQNTYVLMGTDGQS